MTPSSGQTPAVPGQTAATALLRAVRSGSVGVSRVIWRVLSTLHREHDADTQTAAAHLAHPAGGGPAPPAEG